MTTQLTIRQSGGANIVSIPKTILNTLGLRTGSSLNLSIVDHKIVLTPAKEETTLEALLKGSSRKKLLNEKDKKWLNAKAKGKEV